MLRFTLLLAAALGCGGAPARPADPTAATLATTKARIMAADYGADVAALARLRDAVTPLASHPEHGYLARYWAGFASWRMAINGASNGMPPEELRANLERAVEDFEASIALREDFADSHAAAASAGGWLAALRGGDRAAMKAQVDRMFSRLARARELAPDNPRVLWVEGGTHLFRPRATAEDHARAEAIYTRMAEVAGAPVASSPLPDWGKPEALMSLAYLHLERAQPDLARAEEEARAALALQPGWSYVKRVLLPKIQAARATAGDVTTSRTPPR